MSTIKVTNINNASASSGGIALDSSGHVQVDGLQMPTAGALSNRNKIINGDMRIDQRNAGSSVSFASSVSGFPVDRFEFSNVTDGAWTGQRSTTAPTGFTNSLLLTVTTADASLGATQFATVSQKVEGFNVADLGWGTASAKTVTLSFWVRSSLTGTFGGAISNSAQNRSYPFTYTINSSNTFEYKTVTVTGDTSGTWLSDNGVGLRVYFGLGVGSTYSGTAGAWGGAFYTSATGATSVVGTNGATFYITGVQLEVGEKATPFEHRSYGDELARCFRYYQRLGNQAYVAVGTGIQQTSTNTSSRIYIRLLAPMRGGPSLNFSGLILTDRILFDNAVNAMSDIRASTTGVYALVTSATSGGGSYRPILLTASSSSGYLELNAEL